MLLLIETIICLIWLLFSNRFSISLVNMFYWLVLTVIGNTYFLDRQNSNWGSCYILFCCIVFAMGSLIGNGTSFGKRVTDYQSIKDNKTEVGFFKAGYVCMFIILVYSFITKGYSLASGIQLFIQSGNEYFNEASENGGILSLIINVMYAYLISVFAIDGYYQGNKKESNGSKSQLGMLLLGTSIYAILAGRKSLVIWPVLFWGMGLLTGTCESVALSRKGRNSTAVFIKKNIKKLFPYIVLFLVVICFMFATRNFVSGNVNKVSESFMVYLFGEIPVFNEWFANADYSTLQYSHGRQIVFGIIDQFGLESDTLYSNYPLLGYGKAGMLSNIYSAFRSYIEDFGFIGCIILHFFAGILTGISEYYCRVSKKHIGATIIVSIISTFILFSFIISAWHYFTVFIANVLFATEIIYIKSNKHVKIRF